MRSMIWSAVLVHLKGRALAFQILIHSSSAVASSSREQNTPAVQAAALQFGEPPLDLADPRGIRGREVQLDAGMGQQPPVDGGCLVRGQVVADHVDGQAGVDLPVDLVEEVAEVDGPVLGGQAADHLAGGGVQRGEQVDGAVPDVVEAAPLGGARASSAAPARSAPAPGSAASRRPRRPPRSPAAPGTGPRRRGSCQSAAGPGRS